MVKKRVTINLDQNQMNEFDRPSTSSSEQVSVREKEHSVFDDDNVSENDESHSEILCLRVEEKH
jgi:hypothetical protein